MAGTYYLAEVPQNSYRFKLYDNIERLTWQEIRAKTGCDKLVPLAYFNLLTFKTDSATMIDGKWIEPPQWHEFGICIDYDGRLTLGTELDATCDYAVALPPMVYNGQKYASAKYYSTNGCTAVGIKADGTVVLLLCGKEVYTTTVDGVKTEIITNGLTSNEMVAALVNAGCIHVLRYDGSWTSQGDLGNGVTVQPSQKRIARNYLLVFHRDNENGEGDDVDMEKPAIIERMMTNSQCYRQNIKCNKTKAMLHSTGTPGGTALGIINNWNTATADAAVEFVIDDTGIYQALPLGIKSWHCGVGTKGVSANNTHIAVEVCEPYETRVLSANWRALSRGGANNTAYAVKLVQQELAARGYDPKGVDGSFGPGCEAAVKAFQKDSGLSADGSVGPATLKALQSRTGSYLAYPVEQVKPYFDNVYAKTVQLFAWLLTEVGGKAEEIIDHAEGYKQGIASNHADTGHWFPLHGKTMDVFRADVAAAMVAGAATKDPLIEAVDKLASLDVVDSPDYWKAGEYSAENVIKLIIKFAKFVA